MTRDRSRYLPISTRPPWPVPEDLAPEAEAPPMDNRESFVRNATSRFGDDEFFAAERWNAARRLMVDGDFKGLGISSENGEIRPGPSGDGSPEAPDPEDPKDKAGALDRSAGPARKATSSGASARTLAAWLLTPREAFVPPEECRASYLPHALPIGHGQTISAPYMVTQMTAALNPGPSDSVLEIGTGSGYQAAMLSVLSGRVRSVEYVGPLAAEAEQTLERLGKWRPWLRSIRRRVGNGYSGWEEGAPYDRIVVTCAIDHVPPALLEQLAPGGIMILPLGPQRVQDLIVIRRRRETESRAPCLPWIPSPKLPAGYDSMNVYGNGTRVMFVPFVH